MDKDKADYLAKAEKIKAMKIKAMDKAIGDYINIARKVGNGDQHIADSVAKALYEASGGTIKIDPIM